jgi:hypothetical protein
MVLNNVAGTILALVPGNDNQRWLHEQALGIAARILHTRWSVLVNRGGSISPILLAIVVIWITMIFTGFGLDAPRNATVVVAFLVCPLSIGAAIFLILEMDFPFDGIIMISSKPMQDAVDHLSQ